MSEMLLFGAGASVEAGVPGVYKMTQEILARFRSGEYGSVYGHVLSFVVGGLLFEAGQQNRDPLTAGVNVEELFNAVQLLADRHTLEAAPFVGSWHAMVDEFDRIYPSRPNTTGLMRIIYRSVVSEFRGASGRTANSYSRDKIDGAVAEAVRRGVEADLSKRGGSSGGSSGVGRAVEGFVQEVWKAWADGLKSASPSTGFELDREFQELFEKRQTKPGKGRIFESTNRHMIAALKSLVWIESPAKITYLRPILNLLGQQKRLVIASLNYDNGVELMCSSNRVPCERGIGAWSETGSFDFPDSGLYLLKLHGSIDWTWQRDVQSRERPMPHSIIRQVEAGEMWKPETQPAVIFGHRNKLTAEGPFLDLLRGFREELSRAKILTVVGYSFRDPHINVYLTQWINSNPEHRVRIVNGPNFPSEAAGYALDLLRRVPSQVDVIPQYAGAGLSQIHGASA